MHDKLIQRIDGSIQAIGALRDHITDVCSIVEAITLILNGDGTLYTCGNGGSAAQALHLAEELIGRYRNDRAPHRAVCLNADPTALTCIANDYGYENVFSRQCDALLNDHDALLVLTTSGNSPNIINALKIARRKNTTTIGLLGNDGGASGELCDHSLIVPVTDSAHIQEAHQVMIHLICEALEES